jgi:hypothetical protein
MPRLIDKGDPSTDYPILIDGVQLGIIPAELEAPPEPVSQYLDRLDGGASEHQRRPFFLGAGNYSDRYTYTFSLDGIEAEDRIKVDELRVRGGIHRLTVWRMVPVVWACLGGLSRYYLPRFRKPAAHLYAGLRISGAAGSVVVTTEAFPVDATLNGDALAVTYAEGPTLTDPGEGGIVVARQPDGSGESADYCAVRVGGDIATGDELMLWGVWSHEVSLRVANVTMRGQSEALALVFVEV